MKNENEKLTLKKMKKDFEIHLYAQGHAKNTITSYNTDISQFINFLNINYTSKVYIDDIDLRILEDYRLSLNNKVQNGKFKSTTKDRKLDTLNALYEFLESRYGKQDLTKKLAMNRTKKDGYNTETGEFTNKIKFLTEEESKELLEKIRTSNHVDKLRDYCIVLLMLSTGVRSCSVHEAKWEDIHFDKKTFIIRNRKGKKISLVPISDELCQAFSSYWMASETTSDIIFLSNKGNPISRTAFNNAIKRVLNYIGIDEQGLSSHIFRHTFVMDMLSRKKEPEKIIRFTGHSSVNGLAPYIHYNVDDLRDCLRPIA
ncbi:MAG: site-specific integrase [Anaerotignum propionicum]|uniref:tyrosine-type recombinase/integrase n=1 Tax=Anaerotignum propionicum TaxID=28446 RepID=UPI002B1ED6F0|nr:site-specific integrase [Anaerotignum propionicum]MEA5056469.1 site-specific integrase [Anaerotignum propionicum]